MNKTDFQTTAVQSKFNLYEHSEHLSFFKGFQGTKKGETIVKNLAPAVSSKYIPSFGILINKDSFIEIGQ